jgi:hypothetical protein
LSRVVWRRNAPRSIHTASASRSARKSREARAIRVTCKRTIADEEEKLCVSRPRNIARSGFDFMQACRSAGLQRARLRRTRDVHAVNVFGEPSCAMRCEAGWLDCDQNETNGCETSTVGRAPHTIIELGAFTACTIGCERGWSDCDGNLENGCEAQSCKD